MATTATCTRFTDEYQLYEELGKYGARRAPRRPPVRPPARRGSCRRGPEPRFGSSRGAGGGEISRRNPPLRALLP